MDGQRGALVLIGGAEDKKGSCLVLREFVGLAGGEDAHIVIFTAAADSPREAGDLLLPEPARGLPQ